MSSESTPSTKTSIPDPAIWWRSTLIPARSAPSPPLKNSSGSSRSFRVPDPVAPTGNGGEQRSEATHARHRNCQVQICTPRGPSVAPVTVATTSVWRSKRIVRRTPSSTSTAWLNAVWAVVLIFRCASHLPGGSLTPTTHDGWAFHSPPPWTTRTRKTSSLQWTRTRGRKCSHP